MMPYTFSYFAEQSNSAVKANLPFVSVTLTYLEQAVQVSALVDSGSTVNVLPYDVGLQLGLVWETQNFPLEVAGVLRGSLAYGVLLTGEIKPFPAMKLAFAWTKKTSTEIRIILGQVNFFQEFKVSFDGKSQTFELAQNK
jgi:hypothetical protein